VGRPRADAFSDLTLRPAREADGPAIGAIKVETWRRAYAGLLSPALLSGLDVAQESAEWSAYARRPPEGQRLIVACCGDEVIGYGRSEPCPDVDAPGAGELGGLYVRPADQGRGAGRAMLTWLVDDLLARGLWIPSSSGTSPATTRQLRSTQPRASCRTAPAGRCRGSTSTRCASGSRPVARPRNSSTEIGERQCAYAILSGCDR
jgi:GNAT superfamily N-acetyltransferase